MDVAMLTDSMRRSLERDDQGPSSEEQFAKLIQTISRSQNNYRELIDNLDQAVFTLSIRGEIRVANRRLCDILGVSFQQIIGHSLSEFIESPSAADMQRALPGFVKKGSWTGSVPLKLKNSEEVRYFACWLQAVLENGQVESVAGWARDITSQQESEMRLSKFFETLREGIFLTTPDGRFLDANPAFIRMFGYDSLEDLQAHNVRDIYADPAQRDDLVAATTTTGIVLDKEIEYRRKDGKHIYCLASAFALVGRSGQAVRFQGRLVDITERREIEAKLRQEQEFVRSLIACFPDLIVVLDAEGHFKFVSERIKDVLGVSPSEYIGRPIGQRTDPEDQAKLTEMLHKTVSGREAVADVEIRVQHADGSWKIMRVSARPLFDEKGVVTGMVSSGRDVTQWKQMEQQLALKEKFAAMGQMMSGVAHELNNPLTAILGLSDLLRERVADEATRRQVELVLQQARRAAGIVQNLLAFTRPALKGMSALRLDEVLREALLLEEPALSKKNILVKFVSPPDLPAAQGDRKLLSQVFRNIIVNAEQAISSTGDRGTLRVSLARVGEYVRVSLADDGPGISPENVGKIFDPFFTTKRPVGGSGLGLTICLAVAKEHGGTIEVESTPGAGATFHVLLPILSEQLLGPAPSPASPSASTAAKSLRSREASGTLKGHTVLIVDDEDSIREVVQDGLASRGMQVHGVATSEAALSYLAGNKCDILLCDYNLPKMNGDQLFERLREQQGSAAPRFVFMTGELFEPSVLNRYRELGAAVLQKPFRISALAALLADLLQPQPSPTA